MKPGVAAAESLSAPLVEGGGGRGSLVLPRLPERRGGAPSIVERLAKGA